jgi:para-aminobenzoate synthetase component 1
MPFSTFFKLNDLFIIGASPERFLKKSGDLLTSQPIKGTIKRGINRKEDDFLKAFLKNNEKERAENMMIVDLVRNDLAKSSVAGTVTVDELFGIYSFKQVHHMISTVSSEVRSDISLFEIIKNAFPMGSMTGAPKIRVMEEIERIEQSKRSIFSGASGYFTPEGDFDLNVIIRTLIYDLANKTASFQVGSAITYDSDPEYEFNECLLKAEAMLSILESR